jgi:hypothetical protein
MSLLLLLKLMMMIGGGGGDDDEAFVSKGFVGTTRERAGIFNRPTRAHDGAYNRLIETCLKFIHVLSALLFIFSEGLLPPNSLEYVGSSAPTSRVYASLTGIQLLAENNN